MTEPALAFDDPPDIIHELPPVQRAVFRVLWRRRHEGLSPCLMIAAEIGRREHSVFTMVAIINAKLRRVGWRIEGRKGRGGGYRLVALPAPEVPFS